MTEAARGALCQAFAVALAALVVGIFHIPQAFLAVLLAQLLGGIPCQSASDLFRRILSAFAGCLAGLAILTLAPNEQWISLPLFFTLTGWGTVFALRRFGPACGILFGSGIVAMFAESFVFPARDIVFGFAHLFSLITATLAAALVGLAFFREPVAAKSQNPSPGSAVVIGAAAVCGLIAACTILPAQLNVSTISSLTTALALTMSGRGLAKKFLGGLLGIVVALVFLIPINGSGNDLAFFFAGSFSPHRGLRVVRPALALERRRFPSGCGDVCCDCNNFASTGSLHHRFNGADECRNPRPLHWIGVFFTTWPCHPFAYGTCSESVKNFLRARHPFAHSLWNLCELHSSTNILPLAAAWSNSQAGKCPSNIPESSKSTKPSAKPAASSTFPTWANFL